MKWPTQKLVVLIPEQYNKLVLCQLKRQLALRLRNKSVISHLWLKIAQTPGHILKLSKLSFSCSNLCWNSSFNFSTIMFWSYSMEGHSHPFFLDCTSFLCGISRRCLKQVGNTPLSKQCVDLPLLNCDTVQVFLTNFLMRLYWKLETLVRLLWLISTKKLNVNT